MASEKTLLVIRHAKSGYPAGVADIARPLSPRGRRDAPALGQWLVEHGLEPPCAWISPAARTQQTWALIAAQFPQLPTHVTDRRIYAASWPALLQVARELPEEQPLAALVGHNPGSEDLVAQLAGPASDPESVERLVTKFPTAAVGVLRFEGAWAELAPESAALVTCAAPRG